MDGKIESLVNVLSMEAFNSLDLLKIWVVVFRIVSMLPFQMQPEGGVGLKLPTTLITPLLGAGVVPSMKVLITLRGVLLSTMLYAVVAAMTSSVVGVLISCGTCTTPD